MKEEEEQDEEEKKKKKKKQKKQQKKQKEAMMTKMMIMTSQSRCPWYTSKKKLQGSTNAVNPCCQHLSIVILSMTHLYLKRVSWYRLDEYSKKQQFCMAKFKICN